MRSTDDTSDDRRRPTRSVNRRPEFDAAPASSPTVSRLTLVSTAEVEAVTKASRWAVRPGVMRTAITPTSARPIAPVNTMSNRPLRVGGSCGGAGSSEGCRHDRSCGGNGGGVTGSKSTEHRGHAGVAPGGPATMHPRVRSRHRRRLVRPDRRRPSSRALYDWAVQPDCGAVVVFTGTVRDHADGREGVEQLVYEAYEEAVVARFAAIAAEARRAGRRSGAWRWSTASARSP